MLIIFGATGDLTKRMLIPSIFSLFKKNLIKSDFPIVCVGRRQMDNKRYIESLTMKEFISSEDPGKLDEFQRQIIYFQLDFDGKNIENFASFLSKVESDYKSAGDRIFYLATPASLFKPVIQIISSCGVMDSKGYKRVIFEKPFGYDLKSATILNKCISKVFSKT